MPQLWAWVETVVAIAFHWDNLFAAIRGEGARR